MTKSDFRYGRARAGKRISSVNEGEKCPREWAKTAGMNAQAAECPGNRRPCAGKPPVWSSPKKLSENFERSGKMDGTLEQHLKIS
jgi:hypothetical protein